MARPRVPVPSLPRFPGWLLGVVCAFYALDGFSEGTCTWEEARAILEQSPELLTHVEQTLTVETTGFALRLGDHYTDLSGQRVAPFTFRAVSKATPNLALDLVVEAELTFFNHEGKAVKPGESQHAHQVRQTLTGIQLRPVSPSSAPDADAAAMNQRTAWIREQSAAIAAAALTSAVVQFPAPPEKSLFSGEARILRDPAKNVLRKVVVIANRLPDSKSGFEEDYEFSGGELFLVRRVERDSIAHPENPAASIYRAVETTFYFQEGAIYQAMEKRYQANDPALLDQQAQAAPEQRIPLSGAESMQFLSKASRLPLVQTPAALQDLYVPKG